MELIKLIEHLRIITLTIDDFNPKEIKINKWGETYDKWGCNIEIIWDLEIVNQFAKLGYNFVHYEMGLVGEHHDNNYYGFHIIIKF